MAGCVSSNIENIVIEPVDLRWGDQHTVCVDTVEGTGLDGLHFLFSNLTDDFYAWYNTGASTDPAIAGRTGVEVEVLVGDTAAQIAAKTVAALNLVAATTKVHAKQITGMGEFLLQVKELGAPNAAFAAGDSTFTLSVVKEGSILDIGFIDGNVELAISGQLFDITAHQTGTEIIGKLITGSEVGPVTVTMKETIISKLKQIVEVLGVEYTPVGGDEVSGIGALAGSKQFQNVFQYSKQLILHPTKNAADDYAGDFCFWVAYPNLNNLVFSGEEDRKAEVEFTFFLDQTKVNQVSKMVIGDWTQNFLKG
jgi:hypothetical protein